MTSTKSWTTPTPEQVSKAVALLARREQHRYFFERLENPHWVEPLRAKGFFANPPAPDQDEKRGTIGFPPWPESRYLARMARHSAAQQSIAQIILDLPETENVRIHEDCVEASLELDPSLSAALVPRIKVWLGSKYPIWFPEKFGRLVLRLAEGQQLNVALDLARALLALRADLKALDNPASRYLARSLPKASYDEWNYGELLQQIGPGLVVAGGERAFELLCDLLESAVTLTRRPGDPAAPHDLSWLWRPAIESHGQNHSGGIRTSLVAATRDAATQLAETRMADVHSLLTTLESRKWRIFQRLAIHLVRRFQQEVPDALEQLLTDVTLFDDVSVHHEYWHLQNSCFGALRPTAQATILSWIENGPDTEEYERRGERVTGTKPAAEDIADYRKRWQRDHLAPIAAFLSPEWKERYSSLVAELGERSHPDFLSYTSVGWVGPTSPLTDVELNEMEVDEIATFCREWSPPDDWRGATREGLARQLIPIVAADPDKFAKHAALFERQDPTYVRAVLMGFRDALKEHRGFAWEPVIALADWVISQPRELERGSLRNSDADPDWGWARKSIADLMNEGFDTDPESIPVGFRNRSWEVVRFLLSDPDPTAGQESYDQGSSMDPAMIAINTVRGSAMHASIRYGLWLRQHFASSAHSAAFLEAGFDAIPELRSALNDHLDVDVEPSLAVRSAYGQWFPWLMLLDRNWATQEIDRIFPESKELEHFWHAAWNAYIGFCPPYSDVLTVLESKYAHALKLSFKGSVALQSHDGPKERLAEHLMVFYWLGHLAPPTGVGLMQMFFAQASDDLRAHAIGFVGRSLESLKEQPDPVAITRLKELWEVRFRLASVEPETHKHELAAAGWWFVSKQFDVGWSLEQLIRVLRLNQALEPEHLILEQLAMVSDSYPTQALAVLDLMLETHSDTWVPFLSEAEIHAILAAAVESDDLSARKLAAAIIERLGAAGNLAFRDLHRAE